MAWFAPRRPPGRVFLTRADGRSLRREIPAELLVRFAEQVLAGGGEEVRGTWQRAGQAGGEAVRACWPEAVPLPDRALLGAGDRKQGPWLEACYPKGAALAEIAEDLVRSLTGVGVPERMEPEAVDARPSAPAARQRREPVLRATAAPPSRPAAVPAEQRPVPAPVEVLAPQAAPPPTPVLPEVLAPGARILPARAPILRPHPDDVFGLWGEPHAEDVVGDSPELRGEDLPWLCPGDRLYSPRRGLCRLLTLEDAQGRWRLRDERGREIEVSSSELTAEFSFDEEPRDV